MSQLFKFAMAILVFGILVVWGAHLLIDTVASMSQAHVAALNKADQ